MKHRKDRIVLENLIAQGIIGRKEAMHLASLPLFEIPFTSVLKDAEGKATQWIKDDPWSEFCALDKETAAIEDGLIDPPFEEFVTATFADPTDPNMCVYTHHKFDRADPLKYYIKVVLCAKYSKPYVAAGWITQPYPGSPGAEFRMDHGVFSYAKLSLEEQMRMMAESRWNISAWMVFNEMRRLTMVTQELNAPKVGKKASDRVKLQSVAQCNVLFLDRLPTKADSAAMVSNELTIPREGHRRIAHYRTLTAPRYSNHPKFQVPNGVRVRSTWVGDTSSMDREGNTYRVCLPNY